MQEMIKIKNASKSFQGRLILKDIHFTIHRGEFICMIGPSGEGKTTLLNLIGGFTEKDDGEIWVHGREVQKPSKECIMVFQEFNQLFPWKTLKENIEFPLIHGKQAMTREAIHARSAEYISMVKLQGSEDLYPYQLSGGMKQRAAIARSLITTPKVLLMDEPFGSLDAQTKSELQKTLLEVWEKTKTTIVFVTHDVREAMILADRIMIVKEQGISRVIQNQDRRINEERVAEITGYL